MNAVFIPPAVAQFRATLWRSQDKGNEPHPAVAINTLLEAGKFETALDFLVGRQHQHLEGHIALWVAHLSSMENAEWLSALGRAHSWALMPHRNMPSFEIYTGIWMILEPEGKEVYFTHLSHHAMAQRRTLFEAAKFCPGLEDTSLESVVGALLDRRQYEIALMLLCGFEVGANAHRRNVTALGQNPVFVLIKQALMCRHENLRQELFLRFMREIRWEVAPSMVPGDISLPAFEGELLVVPSSLFSDIVGTYS